jgi:hypothetical protein
MVGSMIAALVILSDRGHIVRMFELLHNDFRG